MARRGTMSEYCRGLRPELIVDVLQHHCSEARFTRMRMVLNHRIDSIALGLEDLNHSHNATACLRTAESLGLQDVVAVELRGEYPVPESESTSPRTNRKLSMHAHHWLELHRLKTSTALVDWARQRDMQILGTSPHAELSVADLTVDKPMLIAFGNERDGLRETTAAQCDAVFKLPMFGFTESYNLSVCAGMVLSQLTAKKRAVLEREGRRGDLSDERQNTLMAQWLVRDIRGAELILRRALGQLNET